MSGCFEGAHRSAEAGGAVRPRDHHPSAARRRAGGGDHHPGDRDVRAVDRARVVQDLPRLARPPARRDRRRPDDRARLRLRQRLAAGRRTRHLSVRGAAAPAAGAADVAARTPSPDNAISAIATSFRYPAPRSTVSRAGDPTLTPITRETGFRATHSREKSAHTNQTVRYECGHGGALSGVVTRRADGDGRGTAWMSTLAAIERLPSTGIINSVYALGSDYVLRVPRTRSSRSCARHTHRVGGRAGRHAAGVRTPALIAFDDSGDLLDVAYTVYERVPGTSSRSRRRSTCRAPVCCARWVASWRSFIDASRPVRTRMDGSTSRAATTNPRCSWRRSRRGLPERRPSCVAAVLDRAADATVQAARVYRRFLHDDASPANVMVDFHRQLHRAHRLGRRRLGRSHARVPLPPDPRRSSRPGRLPRDRTARRRRDCRSAHPLRPRHGRVLLHGPGRSTPRHRTGGGLPPAASSAASRSRPGPPAEWAAGWVACADRDQLIEPLLHDR